MQTTQPEFGQARMSRPNVPDVPDTPNVAGNNISWPQPQNTVSDPKISIYTRPGVVADVPPPPYAASQATTPQVPTPKPVLWCARFWPVLATISTVLLYCIFSGLDGSQSALGLASAGGCHPYKPSTFSKDKNLAVRLGLKLVEDVPAKKFSNGRVIVIGDVHGMFHELVSLLAKVKFNAESDYLVFAGDMISKGPDSLKVLDFARSHGAGCVRGNHEDRILLHHDQLQRGRRYKKRQDKEKHHQANLPGHKKTGVSSGGYNADLEDDMEMDDMGQEDVPSERLIVEDYEPDSGLDSEPNPSPFENSQLRTDQKLARKLTKKQVAWLNACPIVLRMNNVFHIGQVEVVHAGLIHGVNLEDQDPIAIMNMRTLDRRCHLPSDRTNGQHWADRWNRGEEKIAKGRKHTTVIYGHYASAGLDIRQYTKGIDTNCVRGGSLTAYAIGDHIQEITSVKCRKYLKD